MASEPSKQTEAVQRISQACERCRIKRVRCSGERPCQQCQRRGEECIFGYARGERKQSILSAIDQYSSRKTTLASPTSPSIATPHISPPPESSSSATAALAILNPPDPFTTIGALDDPDRAPGIEDATQSSLASRVDSGRSPKYPKRKSTAKGKTRKTRISSACFECKKRRRKVRCCTPSSGGNSCQTCVEVKTECVYDPTGDRRSKAYYQKHIADGLFDIVQSNKIDELMSILWRTADPDSDVANEIQEALQMAELPSLSSTADPGSTRRLIQPIQRNSLVCNTLCRLGAAGGPRALWYPVGLQERQEMRLRGPEHLITPHLIDDHSPLSMTFTNFTSGIREMLRQGTPLANVLGALDPAVDLVFRSRVPADLFTASTWACEFARNVHSDVFTQLANAFLLSRYMRWIISPTLENFILLPEIMRPTLAQKTIPHYASADLYPIPAVRDCLVYGSLKPREPIGVNAGVGTHFHWPFDMEKAIDTDPVTRLITTSRLLGACASEAKNWSSSRCFLENVPMTKNLLNIIDHQHEWSNSPESSLQVNLKDIAIDSGIEAVSTLTSSVSRGRIVDDNHQGVVTGISEP